MRSSWTVTKLLTIGGLSALKFLITVAVYTATLTATGSIFSGLLALTISPFFLTLTILIIDQFGAGIFFNTIRTIFELPLPTIFPVIGSLIVAPLAGFISDILYIKLGSKIWLFSFLSGFFYNVIQVVASIILYFTIGLSKIIIIPAFLLNPVWMLITGITVGFLGGISGYLSFLTYHRLENSNSINRIQGR